MSDWAPTLTGVLRLGALVLVGYLLLLFVLQRSVVYPGARRASPRPSPESVPPGTRQIWLQTDRERAEAWLLPSDETPAPALVFFHGNGELIEDWREPMEAFRARGVHVLLVEFPGYGHSGGRPTRASLRRVGRAAFDAAARELAGDVTQVVPMGRSLGGAVAADLALDRSARALVLLSTFSSAAAMGWEQFRFPAPLIRDRFDPESVLRSFAGSVLVLHGRADDIVPFEHARRLGRAGAGGEGMEVVELPCAHNDCLVVWPEIVEAVTGFLRAAVR